MLKWEMLRAGESGEERENPFKSGTITRGT